ncbi:PTS mannose/fructose/sorbose transporter subunit IIB [Pediococcus acidilactici]|uniref:PTS system mannose/fructose/N-acetylgalactosamine-transporter subunit IIB n=1 Tax=Pediococcus acidilactici TaxID=1254 RepID=UPI00132C3DA4|nr:PTS sugar transporter subunit IIB [Pediococcus acidilactici]KAF0362789.1 PTS mannose/fructose/sorbose transporter subunit IIB [Pediococcus acidilactici]KAF0366270.1 PTS mannose/fructose/sorbose transporter subunit IIB [Pediococcus acidilactici]KAF0417393.1 PTS mannose/fructose/sorbose transporter subunit IIB [Pediococcus acidilactici]KAF0420837.1 PTS mannose/fructose/sorbose transporter subunit IIB [Pediococcus acidilactici]KAF0473097.1 PTS mannose/fructose/sorbose transporter subunit IIB [
MENLVLTRIDDRLIHGQVMTAWIKNKGADQVVIVDDGVAKDDFMINVLENAVPDNIAIGIFSKEDAVTFFSEPLEAPTIILAKTPQTLEYMVDNGINIDEIDLGGMGAKEGRERLYHTISTNAEENESFKRLIEKGVDAFIQIMPQNEKVDLKDILNK